MHQCHVCGRSSSERVLDLGQQPVSSHFTTKPGAPVVERPLSLAVCRSCGVLQIEQPFPFSSLVPPYEWITYREPESHLDNVVERLFAMGNIRPGARVGGLSFKDDTTLGRFAQRGFDTWRLELSEDLGATTPHANIESVQGLLTTEAVRSIVARRGLADVLIARHVLEHAENPAQFLRALSALLAPGGLLIIEVPDCRANLERQDYTMIWEEHNIYFTAETLPQVLVVTGCDLVSLDRHCFPFEDVLVMVGRKANSVSAGNLVSAEAVACNVALARSYGASHAVWSERLDAMLGKLTRDGRKLAAYGAGHLTCAFLQFHDLIHHFAFVVDDTPQKQGLFLPGSGLPIVPKHRLLDKVVAGCAFGLAPDIEDYVIARNAEFAERGAFYSMLVDSKRSFRRMIETIDASAVT